MERVARLLGSWAAELGLAADDRRRWRAAGLLHDALREAPREELRRRVAPGDARILPGRVLHGPAAAELLRTQGVLDGELLAAVARHTTGHPDFGSLGKALYVADLVEPGRPLGEWRRPLVARLPAELEQATREVAERRTVRSLRRGRAILPDAVDFWNALVVVGARRRPVRTDQAVRRDRRITHRGRNGGETDAIPLPGVG